MELARACTPYTRLRRDLKDCRVALVSTSGAYVAGMEPYTENDLTFRLIPDDTPSRAIRFVPGHFDTSKASVDPNILFPIDRIHDLLATGEIGKISEYHVAMGLTTELRKLKEEVSWDIARAVLQTRPDVVVLTGGWPLCHRTVVTIQRAIESQGISTILITVSPTESEQAVPPRAIYPKPFQLGESLGRPNDPELQLKILRDALGLLHYPAEPGTIITKEYG